MSLLSITLRGPTCLNAVLVLFVAEGDFSFFHQFFLKTFRNGDFLHATRRSRTKVLLSVAVAFGLLSARSPVLKRRRRRDPLTDVATGRTYESCPSRPGPDEERGQPPEGRGVADQGKEDPQKKY